MVTHPPVHDRCATNPSLVGFGDAFYILRFEFFDGNRAAKIRGFSTVWEWSELCFRPSMKNLPISNRAWRVSALVMLACGGDAAAPSSVPTKEPQAASDAGVATSASDSGTREAGMPPGPGTCTLANTARPGKVRSVSLDAPKQVGGMIVDGLYGLTEQITFAGQGGFVGELGAIQETLRVSDNGTSFAIVSTNTFPANAATMGTWQASANRLTSKLVCGAGGPDGAYTATPNAIVLEDRQHRSPVVSTYTRFQ
jgi:hypothetical protein